MEVKINKPRVKKSRIFLITAILLVLALGSWLGIRASLERQYMAVEPGNDTPIEVTVPVAASAREIAAMLEERQLIHSQKAFLAYCSKEGLDVKLKPGHYYFSRSQGVAEIAQNIASGKVVKIKITIPEGYTVEEIGDMLVERNICTEQSWDGAILASYPHEFLSGIPDSGKYRLEGFLFPDTYYIEEDTSTTQIVTMMLDNFATVWENEFLAQARDKNIDIYETIILASLIEEEAMQADERPTISGVIQNRLKIGMPLQLCATVLYCLDQKKTVLSNADLQVESPYNTYIHPGLIPGPIANPGKASIAAALNPEEHSYFYFVSKGDGTHYFSRTFEQHMAATARYL